VEREACAEHGVTLECGAEVLAGAVLDVEEPLGETVVEECTGVVESSA